MGYHKRKQKKVIFPHPLLKSLKQIDYDPLKTEFLLPSYQPLTSSSISSIMIQPTHTKPVEGQKYGKGASINQYEQRSQQIIKCKKCSTLLTQYTLSNDYNCRICGESSNEISLNLIKDQIFDIIYQLPTTTVHRNIIIIQANQYLYQSGIHQVLLNLLKGMITQVSQPEGIQQQKHIGLILFNDQKVFFINQEVQQILISKIQDFQQDNLPLQVHQMSCPIQHINVQFLEQAVEYILYESFKKKKSCIDSLINKLHNLYSKHGYETLILAHNLPQSQHPCLHSSMKIYIFNSDYFYSDNTKQNSILDKKKKSSPLTNNSFMKMISRFYRSKQVDIKGLHYELYNYLTDQRFYDTQCITRCSSKKLGLRNREHENKLVIKQINSKKQVLLDFQVKKNKEDQNQKYLIYFEFQIRNHGNLIKKRIMQYFVAKTVADANNQVMFINDQAFFYANILRAIKQSQSIQKYNQIKTTDTIYRTIYSSLLKILYKLKQINYIKNSEECSIPNNIFHSLTYLYLISKKDSIFYTEISEHNSLYLAKKLYPKIYKIQDKSLKTLKFIPKTFQFQNNPLVIVDDGQFINLVLSELDSHKYYYDKFLQNYFGTSKLLQILDMTEIQKIQNSPMNHQLIDTIQKIRQNNRFLYQPLKIITVDSDQFQSLFSHQYIENQHFLYLHKMLSSIFQI